MLAGFLIYSPIILWGVICAAALTIEDIAAPKPAQPLRGKFLNIVNGLVVCTSIFLFVPLANMLVLTAVGDAGMGLIDLHALFPHGGAVLEILAVVLFIFMGDVFFYLWHRAEHMIPALWEIHAVHHSETNMNATTYLRQHWLEAPLQKILLSIPLALLFKFTPLEVQLVAYISAIIDFFAHMNVRLQLGRFSWVLTGPQLHRLHHSALRRHWNKNYAQIFPVIDMAFGTYVAPQLDEFPPTGLLSRERINSLPAILFWPFKKWIQRMSKGIRTDQVL